MNSTNKRLLMLSPLLFLIGLSVAHADPQCMGKAREAALSKHKRTITDGVGDERLIAEEALKFGESLSLLEVYTVDITDEEGPIKWLVVTDPNLKCRAKMIAQAAADE